MIVSQVQDIKTNTKALIHPVHTMVGLHVSLEGSRTIGGIILLAHITTDTLFTLNPILKVLFQLEWEVRKFETFMLLGLLNSTIFFISVCLEVHSCSEWSTVETWKANYLLSFLVSQYASIFCLDCVLGYDNEPCCVLGYGEVYLAFNEWSKGFRGDNTEYHLLNCRSGHVASERWVEKLERVRDGNW